MRTVITASIQLLVLALACVPVGAASNGKFDVSYLWHSNPVAVTAYRERVLQVLGPRMAPRLKVVRAENLVGLIYIRSGDKAGAAEVAKTHSKLLKARGLEPAAPMLARTWTVVHPVAPATRKNPLRRIQRAAAPKRRIQKTQARVGTVAIEQAIERHIKKLRAQGRIARDERTAWSVYDFSSGKKLVTINEERPLQAASLIKPFIAAAYFSKVERGGLSYKRSSRNKLERMIQRSDNAATNWATRKLGGPRSVERLLKSHYPGVFRNTYIVEYIPRNGRTYRNKASARDYSRFLYALWNERFDGAAELKRLMALPGPDRIKEHAKLLPRSARIFNKTGSTARLCADMGIVLLTDAKDRQYPYTFIGIIEKSRRAANYTTWLRSRSRVIGEVSDIVFSGISARYSLSTG
ncbi:MAG: serine hydrolase, partial [Chromatiales bacterium]|nr:serine hydrolase [Chromatiales bacterium]